MPSELHRTDQKPIVPNGLGVNLFASGPIEQQWVYIGNTDAVVRVPDRSSGSAAHAA